MLRFWIWLRLTVRSSDRESRARIANAVTFIGALVTLYCGEPEMRPRWPKFITEEENLMMDASYSATGWAIVLYGVCIAGVVASLFFNKEDHILTMVMAIAVFGALGLLYESIWGPWCPAWTFCTALFPAADGHGPQREGRTGGRWVTVANTRLRARLGLL